MLEVEIDRGASWEEYYARIEVLKKKAILEGRCIRIVLVGPRKKIVRNMGTPEARKFWGSR